MQRDYLRMYVKEGDIPPLDSEEMAPVVVGCTLKFTARHVLTIVIFKGTPFTGRARISRLIHREGRRRGC